VREDTRTQKVTRPLTSVEASRLVSDLAQWRVHRAGAEDVLDAIRIQQEYRTCFWDAMIVLSALQMDCHTIRSEDLTPGQVFGQVTVLSPFTIPRVSTRVRS